MIVLRAEWVVPVDRPPIHHGWVSIDAGRIVGVGAEADGRATWPQAPGHTRPSADRVLVGATGVEVRTFERTALMPGLVNAHTHLELSWLRDRIPPSTRFTSWVTQLMVARAGVGARVDDRRVVEAARLAIREARETGTSAIGDTGNSLASVEALGSQGMPALVFHELLGFKETTGASVERTRAARLGAATRYPDVRVSAAPHAPYSVSAELFRAIKREVSLNPVPITSVHVGESPEEVELLARGTGEWVRLLRWIGAWRDDWVAPGTGPVEYLEDLGVLDANTLVVHGVQLSDDALARLARSGATLVTCPRSNQWVGVGVPPVGRFYRAGVRVAVGTDSLASVADLNLFAELAEMRWIAPGVAARRLLESATLAGARALGLGGELGSLTAGKRADVLAVALPAGVEDVEEHLVSGIRPSALSWACQAREFHGGSNHGGSNHGGSKHGGPNHEGSKHEG